MILMKTKLLLECLSSFKKLFLLSILLDHSFSTFHWTLHSSFSFVILSYSFIPSFHPIITFYNFISSVQPFIPLWPQLLRFDISTILQVLLRKSNSLVFTLRFVKSYFILRSAIALFQFSKHRTIFCYFHVIVMCHLSACHEVLLISASPTLDSLSLSVSWKQQDKFNIHNITTGAKPSKKIEENSILRNTFATKSLEDSWIQKTSLPKHELDVNRRY